MACIRKRRGSGGGGNGIKLPFDAQEATRSIVRVMRGTEHWGCGFIVADQYVITAAHCLPRGPDHSFDDLVGATVASWDGSDEATLAVIYYDVLSDIAVLDSQTFSGTYLPTAEAFERIVARAGILRVDLSFPVETPLRFYIPTHEGVWLTGVREAAFSFVPGFGAPIDQEEEIPGGTSGSPVFNQKGEVIGIFSGDEGSGANYSVTVVWLAGALPGWLIHLLGKVQEGSPMTQAGIDELRAVSAALAELRDRTGRTNAAIIEEALIAASKR